jgi:hypothetical protein
VSYKKVKTNQRIRGQIMNGIRFVLVSLLVLSVGVILVHAQDPEPESPPKLVETHSISFNDAYGAYIEEYEEGSRDVGQYRSGMTPWMDLLVLFPDGNWYGPERNPSDGIVALPLPEDFWWEVTEAFGVTPNGEVWWQGLGPEGLGPEGHATLHGPESALALMTTQGFSSTEGEAAPHSIEVTAVYSFPFRIAIDGLFEVAPTPGPPGPSPTFDPNKPEIGPVNPPEVIVKPTSHKVTPPPSQKP